MLEPIFSLIALGVLIVTAMFVYQGHRAKYLDVIESGDESRIRDFALKCCNSNRYHLIVMTIGMAVIVLLSVGWGMIISAAGLILVEIRGVGWFFEWLLEKIGIRFPKINLPF